jgi:bifunctional non-homologous end joining protein LigD
MPLQPMLATLADAPMSDPNLVYEPKYDGIRALVSVVPGRRAVEVTIASRLGNDKTAQFPEVVEALKAWGRKRGKPALLDGEIVALDAQRQPVGFQRLQDRIHLSAPQDIGKRTAAAPVALIAFDLLQDGDEDLCRLPLAERRKRLEEALAPTVMAGDALRLAVQVAGDGSALLEEIRATGGEGILVKDRRSPYRPGQRTRDWRKLKLDKRQEFVVGGYTDPRRTRSGFGALLLGLPEADGRLRYTGHVGGGFTEKDLARIKRLLTELESDECPFVARPPANERPHWIRPQLVVEVRFSNWTDEGYLRHPIFLGVRDDVTPETVRREPDAPVQAPPGPVAVPPEHGGAWQRHPGAGGRNEAEVRQLEEAALAEAGVHQARSPSLLRGGGAGAAAGDQRSAARDEAAAERHRRARLLPAPGARGGAEGGAGRVGPW